MAEQPEKEQIAQTTTVKDMMDRIYTQLDGMRDDIDEEFAKELESQLKAKRNGFFIVPNRYWDSWLQKLCAQVISVKLWIIALITMLLYVGLITNIQFASILGVIVALKGAFQTAGVFRKNGKNGTITEMDKT